MEHEDVKQLLGAYALGAVDSDEAHEIEVHLRCCEECRSEALELGEAASGLALGAPLQDLPPGFAERVVQRAAAEPRRQENAVVREFPAARAPIEIRSRDRARRLKLALGAGIAACLVAIAALSVALVSTSDRLAREQAAVEALLRSGRGYRLTGVSGAVAQVVARDGRGVLVVDGLGAPPAGKTYQLWLIDNGRMVDSGLTFATQGGVALASVPHRVKGYDGAAISVEPAGGSRQPTSKPILISSH